ncbi:PilZ domain-containing protein [Ketobacter sp. MCCC 1A13808]|uniref:PilZ domain-containing protein n=1 Tax=Ketobacter sp. MCCC 1A13808 TaxID=2602738 RepID=UPI000F27BFBE|nr:PilZ domain-containing protein [Ketobacter sp. MCCC 1A13808]MVF10652.1 PilZ domain-containing protein [Ketobacter sp. MCCC 1A13808]RLP56072.1 MAG: PilZ domain-containing protein [Ketobacter sp.]
MADQRSHKRQSRKEDAYLEVTIDDAEGGYIQKVIACETVDLSQRGLKIYMSEPVEQGLISEILVEISGEQGRFFLTTEVKWISPTGDDGWYFAGFEIFDAENTDFESWSRMVDQRAERERKEP